MDQPIYDYLIVGAGLFGSVFAREATDAGQRCLIIESRNHIAGNCHTERVDGITVHRYGPHIFHTSDESIWSYAQRFGKFHSYFHSPVAHFRGTLYPLPFNMWTFKQLWGISTPEEAAARLAQERVPRVKVESVEDWALANLGLEIYEKFIYGYTLKQWQRHPRDLPAALVRRIPIRLSYDNTYFDDRYQGIPDGGYTEVVRSMLDGIEVRLEADFFADRGHWRKIARNIVFTGRIDQYFGYRFGDLEYRTLRFETETRQTRNFQGTAQMNFTAEEVPYTRIVEHKHFAYNDAPVTVITREYPEPWHNSKDAFYPINDTENEAKMTRYRELAAAEPNTIFGGRLAEYRYYDMHQVIGAALAQARRALKKESKPA